MMRPSRYRFSGLGLCEVAPNAIQSVLSEVPRPPSLPPKSLSRTAPHLRGDPLRRCASICVCTDDGATQLAEASCVQCLWRRHLARTEPTPSVASHRSPVRREQQGVRSHTRLRLSLCSNSSGATVQAPHKSQDVSPTLAIRRQVGTTRRLQHGRPLALLPSIATVQSCPPAGNPSSCTHSSARSDTAADAEPTGVSTVTLPLALLRKRIDSGDCGYTYVPSTSM